MFVQSPEKIGQDAGSLIGRPPTGVIATNSWDELLALGADCLSYHSNSIGREVEAAEDVCRFLESGVNAVTTSVFAWAYPPDVPSAFARVHQACAKGGSSAYFSGSDPGWATTDLALTALTMTDRVDAVRVGRYAYWGDYTAEYVCRHYYGFGQFPGYVPMLVTDGFLYQNWGPALKHIADALDVEIDGWNLIWETASLAFDIQCGFGVVAAGSSSALRTELQALTGGRPFVVVEHVDRMHPDAAPQWKRPYGPGMGGFRIEIEGDHSFTLEFANSPSQRARPVGPMDLIGGKSTAMPTINAIPAVCRGKPGLLGPLDVPFSGVRCIGPKRHKHFHINLNN